MCKFKDEWKEEQKKTKKAKNNYTYIAIHWWIYLIYFQGFSQNSRKLCISVTFNFFFIYEKNWEKHFWLKLRKIVHAKNSTSTFHTIYFPFSFFAAMSWWVWFFYTFFAFSEKKTPTFCALQHRIQRIQRASRTISFSLDSCVCWRMGGVLDMDRKKNTAKHKRRYQPNDVSAWNAEKKRFELIRKIS